MGLYISLIQRVSNFHFLRAEENNITKVENLVIAEMAKTLATSFEIENKTKQTVAQTNQFICQKQHIYLWPVMCSTHRTMW